MFANQAATVIQGLTGRSRFKVVHGASARCAVYARRLAEAPGGSYHLGKRTAGGNSAAATLDFSGAVVQRLVAPARHEPAIPIPQTT